MCGFAFRRHRGAGRKVGVYAGGLRLGEIIMGMEGLLR